MEFANFDNLIILLGGLSVIVLVQRLKRQRYLAHSVADSALFRSLRPSHFRLLPRILFFGALVTAGLALMEPRIRFKEGVNRLEGLDIVLVVDLSSSMYETLGGWEQHRELYEAVLAGRLAVEDLPETRMEAVQAALSDFVSRRREDRLALVTFSENSYVVSPFTTDHEYLGKYIRMLDPNILIGEGMTAIGEGIGAAIDLFRRDGDPETKNKVVVVFTDGENNFGRNPLEALDQARFYGYRVYLIGVELGRHITESLKTQRLIQAVSHTGGQYFDARDKSALQLAYRTIDRIEKGVFVERTLEFNVPAYQVFLGSALILMVAGLLLNAIPYFVEVD